MPKQSQRLEFNTFIKGIITEASPLSFPANASYDEENFILHADGSRTRRLGIDYETNNPTFLNTSIAYAPTGGKSTFRWLAAGGDPTKNLLVQQVGNNLYFYDMGISPLSTSGYVGSMGLTTLDGNERFSFASVEGKLVVASNNQNIVVITRSSVGALSYEYVRIKVRDQWGVQDSNSQFENDPSYRATGPASRIQAYNLQNQSWGTPRKIVDGTNRDPIQYYYQTLNGVIPSNSETVWLGMQMKAAAVGTTDQPYECFYPKMIEGLRGSSSVAAKGFFIIELLSRGASRIAASYANYNNAVDLVNMLYDGDVPADYTTGGASVVEEFAGRIFFGGFKGDVVSGDARSPVLSNYIAFSQVVKNINDIYKCYQVGDPTSRDGNDLVDTDGGLIRVSGANKIVALKNMNTSLVVLASNGVWTISGGAEYGFSATNYKVSKVSNYGCISASSIVTEGDRVYYMSDTGIYVIGRNQMGDLSVESITLGSIQSLYDDIPLVSKQLATAVYDLDEKKLRWIYKTGTSFSSTSSTYELVFDIRLGAFSRNRIYSNTAYNSEVYGAVLDSNNVLRYITLYKSSSQYYLTFSQYKDTAFIDWKSSGAGVDAKAYLITGMFTGGDSSISKQTPYLVMQFERTEAGTDSEGVLINPSSCKVRSQWDWSNSTASNKWGPLFQAYRYRRPLFVPASSPTFDTGFELITTKSKLRGRGKAFSLYMETEPQKDCRLYGWNLNINANDLT